MYSDSDLEAAVAAGAMTPEAATALRAHSAAARAAPPADEEHFRLITGFNDIFVTIAAIMLLVAVGWIGGTAAPALGAAAVAATSWGLAEYFTRVRRMALPSIVLLASFVYAVFFAALLLIFGADGRTSFGSGDFSTSAAALRMAGAGAVAAGAAWLHWRRFMVPITVAAGTGALVVTAIGLLLAAIPAVRDYILPLVFLAGLAIFALAMWWDVSDRARTTRRSDVAFWLHLSAAPMIVHPIFSGLGLIDGGDPGPERAVVALALYIALAFVALVVDRRALLVSALAYVLVAMASLFNSFGSLNLSFAFTALVVGSALLLLSAFWHRTRSALVRLLPGEWRDRLPVIDRDLSPQRAS